jgi:hypothetical protein
MEALKLSSISDIQNSPEVWDETWLPAIHGLGEKQIRLNSLYDESRGRCSTDGMV